MARHCFAGRSPSRRTGFRFRVALCEAISNGIRFGAGAGDDPRRTIRVAALIEADRIRVEVSDGGRGFDPAAVPEPTAPGALEQPFGRGLFLIRHLVDRVEFNERGNTIWMTLPRS
jgi:serine/threonine-protein kinase RsbW